MKAIIAFDKNKYPGYQSRDIQIVLVVEGLYQALYISS